MADKKKVKSKIKKPIKLKSVLGAIFVFRVIILRFQSAVLKTQQWAKSGEEAGILRQLALKLQIKKCLLLALDLQA